MGTLGSSPPSESSMFSVVQSYSIPVALQYLICFAESCLQASWNGWSLRTKEDYPVTNEFQISATMLASEQYQSIVTMWCMNEWHHKR